MALETPPAVLSPVDAASQLIDLLPTLAWTLTADGRVDFINRQWCAFTGLSREQLLNSNMGDCTHIEDHQFKYKFLELIVQARPFEYQVHLRRYDGEYRRCLARAVPVTDSAGQLLRWVGTTTDVEDLRRATDQLKLKEDHLQLALESADVGIWRMTLPGIELTVDERARKHFVVDEYVVQNYDPLNRIHPQDVDRVRAAIVASHDPSQSHRRHVMEHRAKQPDGSYRWLSVHARVLFEGEGENATPVLVTGASIDITARKLAEEQVQRLNADLELRVQQRTAELTAANEELESFAYAVSHDLRAPLRAMWGFCDALIEDYGSSLPPEAHEYLQHVIDGSRQLGEIIDGLLALSRSTRGTLRRDVVDLSTHAEKILRDMVRIEPDRRVTWAIEPALRARGDSRMIDAVLRNLLGNAWKYTTNRSDATIRVYADHDDGEYTFCVEDNGAGFNMEHAEKLFQPFQRLHRQDEFSGLGIGLATVQRIIHRHGGKVSGTGTLGQGALFRFSLPLPDDVAADNTEQEGDS